VDYMIIITKYGVKFKQNEFADIDEI